MESKGWNENQIFLYDMISSETPQCGIMLPVVTENNRVKCVFWDEKDSIFALDLVSVKVRKQTGFTSDTRL
jgi:hypothetical protein